MRNAWAFLLVAGIAMNAAAQGTFLPATYASDPNFNHSGGTIYSGPGVLAYGSGYQGQYYIGPAGTTDPSALVAVGPQAGLMGTSPSDPAAGYFEGNNNNTITTSFAGGSTVTLQLRVWQGNSSSTYGEAQVRCASSLLQLVLGNPNGSPPTSPTSILSMPNFAMLAGPEPATIVLGLIGASALFSIRRK